MTDVTPATVTLGEVQFDPTEASDFALSVEGTRGMGKSNTLAVILEDLAEVAYPTLIIERVGALLPVRVADESIIVVGEKDEPGVDLVVPLEELDRIGEWVLDRGLKVFVDISTYADHTSQDSRIHLAAARAVRSLMNRAEEKYKAPGERRTKSLLVIDEADYLAPKDNAPTPDYKGENVRRARGHIVRASTEGGNYGVSPIVGYQRRAFIANGVLNLCVDWIVHGLESDDLSRAAKSLRVDDDLLDGLGTGEIVAKGQHITSNEVVGPTQVRKRRTPDPREDTFELPETPPEVEDALRELQNEVSSPELADSDEEDESDGLEARVDTLESENERLRSELEAAQAGEADEALQEELDRLTDDLDATEARVDSLQDNLTAVRDERDAYEDEVERLEARVAELEALENQVDSAAEALHEALDHLGRGDPEGRETADELSRLRSRVDELEQENERLREAGGGSRITIPDEYAEFFEHPTVEEAIEAAIAEGAASSNAVWGVILTIADEASAVGYDSVAERMGYADNTQVSKAVTALKTRNVIEVVGKNPMRVDFAFGQMEEIERKTQMREEMQQRIEQRVGT